MTEAIRASRTGIPMASLFRKSLILLLPLLLLMGLHGREAWASIQASVDPGSYVLVSSVRVSRFEFDYTYTVEAVNGGSTHAESCLATVRSSSANTVVLDGSVGFGPISPGGRAVGTDTFTFRQNRQFPFDPAALAWDIQCTEPANTAPVADAGADQTVFVGSSVTLNASGSSDADGDSLTFQWAFISRPTGSTAALSDPGAVMPTFLADVEGPYEIRLVVNDGTVDSAADIVVVTTTPQNIPPVARAGADQNAFVGDLVTLDGTASTDANGDALTFAWAFVSVPAGSATTLTNPGSAQPTFTPDLAGDYTARLLVDDGRGGTSTDDVTVSTQLRNQAPTANAGPDQSIVVGQTVLLDGNASSDPEGTPLTFAWTFVSRPAASQAALVNADTATPSFTADVAGNFVVQLIVSDGLLSSAADTVLVSTENTPPVANAGPDQSVDPGDVVQLDGSASSDADGDPLSFAWSLATRPPGSVAAIGNPLIPNPTFTADLPGLYVAQLLVNDGTVDSAPDTVNVTATAFPQITLAPTVVNLLTGDSATVTVSLSVAAPAGGQAIDLASDNTGAATVPASVTVAQGQTSVTFQVTATNTAGSAAITASATGFSSTTANVNVAARGLAVTLEDSLVGVGRSINGTASLSQPAPAGGVAVSLVSGNPGVATVAQASVTIAQGATQAGFTVSGVALGTTEITASATGFDAGVANVTVTGNLISLGTIPTAAPGQSVDFPVSLTQPAPAGGVTIQFVSDRPDIATVTPSVTVPAGQLVPTANPQITGVGIGTALISASASGFAPDSANATVTLTVTLSPPTLTLAEGSTQNVTLTLSAPAPVGGLVFDLSSSDTSVFTVPASVSVAEGQLSASVAVTAVAPGTGETLTASAAGIASATSTVDVTTAPAINISNVTVGEDLQQSVVGFLAVAAPPVTGVAVTITSADPTRLRVSSDPLVLGGGSAQVTVSGNATTMPAFYLQALAGSGTVEFTVSANGYATQTRTATLTPSGFVDVTQVQTLNTTTFSPDSTLTIHAARLIPGTLAFGATQAVRPAGAGLTLPVAVVITSSDTNVGAISVSPVAFTANVSNVATAFDPINAGTTTISVVPPAGWDTPSAFRTISATVTAPNINGTSATQIGRNLQETLDLNLAQVPPAPVDIAVTSASPAIAVVSTSGDVLGGAGVVFPAVANSTPRRLYVQATGATGQATTLTISAPGFNTATVPVTIDPSGFADIHQTSTINTTTFSADTALTISSVRLTPGTLAFSRAQELRPAGLGLTLPILVAVTSSDTNIGVVTTSPLAFDANVASVATAFDPLNAGTTTVSVEPPAGFDAPANFRQLTVNVTAPGFVATTSSRVGEDLQDAATLRLAQTPPAPVDITVTSADPAVARVSADATVLGSASFSFTGVANLTTFTYYIQSVGTAGQSTDVTISAPGFATLTVPVVIDPSGFVDIHQASTLTTTTFSPDTSLTVSAARLSSANLAFAEAQLVRPAGLGLILPVQVPVVSSDTNTGVITTSPVSFGAGVGSVTTAFDPLTAGTTTISVEPPARFETPSSFRQIAMTVNAPSIFAPTEIRLGEDLQGSFAVRLGVTPPGPVTLTLSVASASVARISDSGTTLGGASLTFPGVADVGSRSFFMQAVGTAGQSTTLTVSAPGYSPVSIPVSIDPSGFVNITQQATINTAANAANITINVHAARLNQGTFNFGAVQALRPAGLGLSLPVQVPVLSSAPAVGAITASPLSFGANVSTQATAFDPLSQGTSTITYGTPAGFDTPNSFRQNVVNVGP